MKKLSLILMVLFGLCVLSGCNSSITEPKKPMVEEPAVSAGSSVIVKGEYK